MFDSRKPHHSLGRRLVDAALAALVSGLLAPLALAAPAPAGTLSVVEFFHRDLQYYFRTADAAEISLPDSGVGGPAWVRNANCWLASVNNSRAVAAVPLNPMGDTEILDINRRSRVRSARLFATFGNCLECDSDDKRKVSHV